MPLLLHNKLELEGPTIARFVGEDGCAAGDAKLDKNPRPTAIGFHPFVEEGEPREVAKAKRMLPEMDANEIYLRENRWRSQLKLFFKLQLATSGQFRSPLVRKRD